MKNILRKIFALAGFTLFILPLIFILWQEISSPLGQSNPFMIIFILMYGGIPAIIGLLIYIFVYPRSKTKFMPPLLAVISYLLLLPIMWGIHSIKESLLLARHEETLEEVATALLLEKISTTKANEILQKREINVSVDCIPQEKEHVLFLFGGIIDNCYGIAWSITGKQPSENCCGDFTSWEQKEGNWYIWSTT